MDRRTFITSAAALPLAHGLPSLAQAPAQARQFAPGAIGWRTFEVVTEINVISAGGVTRAWVPVPTLDTEWQQSQPSTWSGNMADVAIDTDKTYGAKMVRATWAADEPQPKITVVSRVRTRDRALDWTKKARPAAVPADLALALRSTELIPVDGIVKDTATKIVAGRTTDLDKTRALYDWVVHNTYRDPQVAGCGVGDVRAMLTTGNLGGKCADLNALFVGLCRSVGVPARDVYGIRVAKSAFPYKELGAGSPNITKAQHCRAEVWLADYGWVAMDPADVAKVMRQETPDWIKDPGNPIAKPVYTALFGTWEGNWMGYNTAHDVPLPGSTGPALGFLMYPQCETKGQRVDCLDPDTFEYKITAREVAA